MGVGNVWRLKCPGRGIVGRGEIANFPLRRRRTDDANTCRTNGMAMFCIAPTTTPDPPLNSASHVSEIGGHSGSEAAGLRKCRTGSPRSI